MIESVGDDEFKVEVSGGDYFNCKPRGDSEVSFSKSLIFSLFSSLSNVLYKSCKLNKRIWLGNVLLGVIPW